MARMKQKPMMEIATASITSPPPSPLTPSTTALNNVSPLSPSDGGNLKVILDLTHRGRSVENRGCSLIHVFS